jgi:hypothetical protein
LHGWQTVSLPYVFIFMEIQLCVFPTDECWSNKKVLQATWSSFTGNIDIRIAHQILFFFTTNIRQTWIVEQLWTQQHGFVSHTLNNFFPTIFQIFYRLFGPAKRSYLKNQVWRGPYPRSENNGIKCPTDLTRIGTFLLYNEATMRSYSFPNNNNNVSTLCLLVNAFILFPHESFSMWSPHFPHTCCVGVCNVYDFPPCCVAPFPCVLMRGDKSMPWTRAPFH